MKRFVLLRTGQEAVTGQGASELVVAEGFVKAASTLGVGASTLRKFLNDEGFRFARHTSWQVEPLPGLEGTNGDGGVGDDVQAPGAGGAEPAGTGV